MTRSDRIPPHNLDAEASLIGAMLLSRDAVAAAMERNLRPEEFYKPVHQHVFDAIKALSTSGEPIDVVTVAEELRRAGQLEVVGGLEALVALQNATPAVSSADRYARIVRDTARLRRLLAAAVDIAEIAYASPDDVERAVDEAESRIFDVSESESVDSSEPVGELIEREISKLEERYSSTGTVTGVPTGLTGLDQKLLGLQPGTLNIVGARPAMGKSAFGLGIAVNAARETGKPVLFFSLEMGKSELAQRILSAEAGVDSMVLRTGKPSANQWSALNHAVGRLNIPLILDDGSGTTVGQIRSRARRVYSREGGLALIVVDYLQLMGGDEKVENRQLEVSDISRRLKLLAREFQVPVLALSQLSRQLETRADKRPTLADLRESGALEQDADVVMFLYRDHVYTRDPATSGDADLIIAKHRAGPIGDVRLAWIPRHTKFDNVAPDSAVERAMGS